ncbi:UDP-glucose/GDP-mannose dehydrogenase family protein [Paenibacillus sp. SYP-B3998]|uniref:UDP-glucose 6-dehydrogenase n=1 Tax=Paenibacillus sp. SYP-B3998 TaxID=2678564 RepID=A0A6G3ZYN1_9BACL|nr:UDP-glucose/GDP-mannose dehydrogenase family protein [Paenibacillus sp. SYP-B3998]NEW07158.1 UDP-glucose/GDP-mannose dehydrogenase family protein [Paenibacillus sp. SYP-B3998]
MKITVIGTGYVGLVSGVCFSNLGNEVTCVDKDKSKIDMLHRGEVPIYEPGLKELIEHNVQENRLSFTGELAHAVKEAEVIILAVGTPSLPNGEANLQYIEQAVREVALAMNEYKIIMTKSTVPVGTNERISQIIGQLTELPFDVVSVPEFLREGSAVKDTFNPDRIVIGVNSQRAEEKIVHLHKPLTENIIVTDVRSAEMIKYASNAFLATKISFINEVANICEKVGADVTMVAKGMGQDRRIGSSFLSAGIGYGGSCFPKDTNALIQIAGNVEYNFKLLKAVVEVNTDQRFNIIDKLTKVFGDLEGKTIGIWGLAFKPNTDDVREAPAIEIVETLVRLGAKLRLYDPIAMEKFKGIIGIKGLEYCTNALETAIGCDAICLLTEWDEFCKIDLSELKRVMHTPVLIDGRNVFSEQQIRDTSFQYYSIGRPQITRLTDVEQLERVN